MKLAIPYTLVALQAGALLAATPSGAAENVALGSLKLARHYYWDAPKAGITFDKHVPSMGGVAYPQGISFRGPAAMAFALNAHGQQLTGLVGIDDEVKESFKGPAECLVYGDQRLLWRSGPLTPGSAPKKLDIPLGGVHILELVVEASGDEIYSTHVDWANLVYSGEKPLPIDPPVLASEPKRLTPPTALTPRINGARQFGVRPGAPFLFTIAASGQRPMTFSASALPPGLTLDADTGRITGAINAAGGHVVTLQARNALGSAERKLRIVAGETLALAPAMGWSSWNCWASKIDQDKVLHAARAMAASGLSQHGYTYVNIDDAWQGQRGGAFNALQGNEKFPDIKGMCDEIHGLGLKVGIYSTPWVKSYAGYQGGSGDNPDGSVAKKRDGLEKIGKHPMMANDARQWAAWGIDYLKCDWWPPKPAEAKAVAEALRCCGRDILLSLSCDAPFEYAPEYRGLANSWRTTTDITDTWESLCGIAFSQDRWAPFGGPGHWIDPDMLEVGHVANGPTLHPTRLTPDEQYLHLSMWSLLSAPLIVGCDLEKLDDFTLGLLTNDEVLDIDQDPLGTPARRVSIDGAVEVWVKPLEDGSKAVGLFNRGRQAAKVAVTWAQAGLQGKRQVRDLWRQQDLGLAEDSFSASVAPHGVVLVRIR